MTSYLDDNGRVPQGKQNFIGGPWFSLNESIGSMRKRKKDGSSNLVNVH